MFDRATSVSEKGIGREINTAPILASFVLLVEDIQLVFFL